MERTISAMIGKGSVNHNTRAFTAKNVDKNRSADNVEFCQEDIKQVYHKLFDEARERYNAKQKRKDRMIDNYYEKIRRGKQEKLFHEVIFQIGNKDDMNAKSEDGLLAKRILTEFMDEFQARNPNLYVFSAHLHMDEETPHLHIDFVPYINVQLEKQQKELKSNIEKMVQSEEVLQRDVRKYDEAPEWQLPEPGAFASAKSFRDKVVLPLVNKLKSLVKNLTIQCVRLKEEVLKLRKEKRELSESVGFYKGKIRDMNERTELLQEKADDLERVKRYAGAEQIDTIVRKVKEQERTEQQIRRYDKSYGTR